MTTALCATFTQIWGFGVGFGVLCPVSRMQLGQFLEALPMYFNKHTCIVLPWVRPQLSYMVYVSFTQILVVWGWVSGTLPSFRNAAQAVFGSLTHVL